MKQDRRLAGGAFIGCWRRAAALLWLCLVLPLGALAAEPQPLTVVSDDTYPPYIFRNAEGALDG
ncbi:MAG TPA: hypothetical protein VI279_02015, partial [Rhodocyclaceae bacterium]